MTDCTNEARIDNLFNDADCYEAMEALRAEEAWPNYPQTNPVFAQSPAPNTYTVIDGLSID